MKKQITLALLLVISALSACKKAEGTHVDIVGTWKVAKVETAIAGSAVVTYTGTSSDYFEFRGNKENEVVVNLNSNSSIGTYYVLVSNGLKITYGGKSRNGDITTISDNKLEFTVTVDGATPQTTEKYYLTK